MNNSPVPDPDRIRIPIASITIAINNTLAKPKRRASFGANGDKMAKANNGRVVIAPAKVFDKPRSS
ncbi:hypothetical protein D3C74_480760 [compost metagenome]